jgi:hypothetical protein
VDQLARVGPKRESAYAAGDSKAWRDAIDEAIELPIKVTIAQAQVLAAELAFAKAQLAQVVERSPSLDERLKVAEATFQAAETERNRAASAARTNGTDRQELRLAIRRLEREAAAHQMSSIGRVASP